jgi:hypothetical protein
MRVVNGFMCVLLVAFGAVQYNDPDFYFWMPVYAVPAVWAGLACYRPRGLSNPVARALLGLSLAAAVVGCWWFWPRDPGFWKQEVWWESETAREGLGMMIVTVALVLVVVAAAIGRAGHGENSRLST